MDRRLADIRIMAEQYTELFLKWTANGENAQVKAWLESHGLRALPMQRGLLIAGSRSRIEAAFSVSLENRQPPFELPIPAELQPYVASITLPRPRSYHS